MELTDLATIRALCEKYDFALSKGFGQNFIINPGVPAKIVDAAGIDRRYGVIEIGPGIGVLTKEMAKRAGKVVAIEVDKRLPPVLAETLAGFDNVKVILQDVLKTDLRALVEQEFPGMPVAVCANLPYYITSPIIMKLLDRRAAGRPARHPGERRRQLRGALLCPAPDDVHRPGRQLLPRPQGHQRGGADGHPAHPCGAGAGRGGLFCPGAGRLWPAPQDRGQLHRRRPETAPAPGGRRPGGRRPGPPGPARAADIGGFRRPGRRFAPGGRAVNLPCQTIRAVVYYYSIHVCWCGAMAAQLICNQWVAGSTPVTSSREGPATARLWGFFLYRKGLAAFPVVFKGRKGQTAFCFFRGHGTIGTQERKPARARPRRRKDRNTKSRRRDAIFARGKTYLR